MFFSNGAWVLRHNVVLGIGGAHFEYNIVLAASIKAEMTENIGIPDYPDKIDDTVVPRSAAYVDDARGRAPRRRASRP
jgi:hypothetical protein